jgi:hypothetical protein
MVGLRTRAGFGHLPLLVLLGLTLASLLLQGGSLPHTHQGAKPGLYNQEHDLTTLATFGGVAPLPAAMAAVALVVVLVTISGEATTHRPGAPRRHADFRAPPAR